MIRADFHVHTTASDGRILPDNILSHAVKAGLTHIAITDHDTVDGLIAIEQQRAHQQIKVIPGIEFSTDMPSCEIHILGYGINIHHDGLQRQLVLLKNGRIDRVQQMAEKLTTLGYPVDAVDILRNAQGAASLARPHVAKALVEKGYFTTISDVFNALLDHDKPGYVPHYKLTPQEVIQLIRQAGGVSVLAHPGLVGNDQLVGQTIDSDVDGIEVFHPKHDAAAIKRYSLLAKQHNLVVTGGSDFHAIPGRYPEQLGDFVVPDAFAQAFIRFLGPNYT